MKARTLTITIGAALALVAVTVQPAGANVASKCTVPQKKVLVVGNGTKAPYYAGNPRGLESTTAKSCGKAVAKKADPKIVHRSFDRPLVVTPLPAPGDPGGDPRLTPLALGRGVPGRAREPGRQLRLPRRGDLRRPVGGPG